MFLFESQVRIKLLDINCVKWLVGSVFACLGARVWMVFGKEEDVESPVRSLQIWLWSPSDPHQFPDGPSLLKQTIIKTHPNFTKFLFNFVFHVITAANTKNFNQTQHLCDKKDPIPT